MVQFGSHLSKAFHYLWELSKYYRKENGQVVYNSGAVAVSVLSIWKCRAKPSKGDDLVLYAWCYLHGLCLARQISGVTCTVGFQEDEGEKSSLFSPRSTCRFIIS